MFDRDVLNRYGYLSMDKFRGPVVRSQSHKPWRYRLEERSRGYLDRM